MQKFTLILLFVIPLTLRGQEKDSLNLGETRIFNISSTADQYKKYLPNYAPQSPNSAGLLNIQEYAINFATGVPDISIPIFTVQEGDLSLPITLRYHAGSHRISEQASWVGWGFSLDHGSSITRSVQGLPDDYTSDVTNNYLNNTILTSRDLCNTVADYNYAKSIRSNNGGLSPDIFSYSIGSKSGKFLMGQEGGEPFLMPYQPVQIIDSINSSGLILGFDIIDSEGTSYQYGVNESGVFNNEGHYNTNGRWTSSYTGAWHLNKISSVNTDNHIDLVYQTGGNLSQESYQWSASILSNVSGTSPLHYTASSNATAVSTPTSDNVSTRNLQKILFTNGELEFIQSSGRNDLTNAYQLDEINVYNYQNGVKTFLRSIHFTYSYFKDDTNADGKLKLDKLEFKNAAANTVYEYGFQYFTDSYSWTESSTDFNKQDYFGYYNGKNNQSLISLSSFNVGSGIPITNGGADRTSVSTYSKEGVLKSIISPTKGVTTFDFENNKYKYDGTEYVAGGLRVKSIARYPDSTSIPIVKRYEYSSSDGAGIGKLSTNWDPSRANLPTTQTLHYENSSPAGVLGEATQHILTANSSLEIGTFDSAPVYYTHVTEYFENDTSTVKNGKNEYEFSFAPDLLVNSPYVNQRDLKVWERGNLLSQTTLDSSDNVMRKTDNNYQNFKESTKTAAGFLNTSFVYEGDITTTVGCSTEIINYSSQAEMIYGSYSYNTGQTKLISSSDTVDNVASSQSISYDDYLLPDTTKTIFAYSGRERESITVYPTHATYLSDVVADSMRNRNMIALPLEQVQRETISSSTSTFYKQKNVYELISGSNARGLSSNILPRETWVAPTAQNLEKRVEFSQYDTDGNVLEYKVDGIPTSFAYAYNNQLPIVKAENISLSNLNSGFSEIGKDETDFETTTLSSTQLAQIKDLKDEVPEGLLTWYAHYPHVGLSQTVSPEGILSSFAYDNFQRMSYATDHNDSLTDVYQYHYATELSNTCEVDPPYLFVTAIDTCFISITASACTGTVNWNTSETGAVIQVGTGSVQSYFATCTDGNCTSDTSNILSLPQLYQGWNIAEIGSPPLAGCVFHNENTITISSSGNKGLGTSDQFNYVYKNYVEDSLIIIAKLESITDSPDENMRSGLMIRTSTATDAAYYEIIYDEKNEALGILGRATNGATTQFLGYNFDTVPLWLRLKKRGDEISTWVSSNASPNWNNDSDWVQIGTSQTNSLFDAGFLIGLESFNGSYSTNYLINTSTFSNISIHTF